MDRYSLKDYLAWSRTPDNLVLVREIDGHLVALVHVVVESDHILVDKFVRSQAAPAGSAGPLLRVVEQLARHLGKAEVRLQALNHELQEYYAGHHGYENAGPTEHDPDWGTLIPMRKRIRPR